MKVYIKSLLEAPEEYIKYSSTLLVLAYAGEAHANGHPCLRGHSTSKSVDLPVRLLPTMLGIPSATCMDALILVDSALWAFPRPPSDCTCPPDWADDLIKKNIEGTGTTPPEVDRIMNEMTSCARRRLRPLRPRQRHLPLPSTA